MSYSIEELDLNLLSERAAALGVSVTTYRHTYYGLSNEEIEASLEVFREAGRQMARQWEEFILNSVLGGFDNAKLTSLDSNSRYGYRHDLRGLLAEDTPGQS